MSGIFNKDFTSLKRSRKHRTIGSGGFRAVNTLEGSPTLELQLKKSQHIRDELDSLDHLKPVPYRGNISKPYRKNSSGKNGPLATRDTEEKPSSQPGSPVVSTRIPSSTRKESTSPSVMCDVFSQEIHLTTLLDDKPLLYLILRSINFNGKRFVSEDTQQLMLNISSDNEFIYFTQREKLINRITINRKTHLKGITFSKLGRSLLLELKQNKGYIYINYLTPDDDLMIYFRRIWDIDTNNKVSNQELLSKMEEIEKRRLSSTEEIEKRMVIGSSKPHIIETPTRPRRSTRGRPGTPLSLDNESSNINSSPFGSAESPETVLSEKPASFDPPLNYKFMDSKMFTLTYSDFKTLYNNDWINDSVIDFFIKYDIENAVKENKFKWNDILAFNSFFFTKLVSGTGFDSAIDGEIDYYGNIKRWLVKVDLMSHPYVIIPINENLHWYCCVIKGLPQLLERALKYKEQMKILGDLEDNDVQVVRDPLRAEIFIFDSLSLKHSHTPFPLKKFIMDYCFHKYEVEIPKEQFRVINARVPKQNNFNDCGIHVIYNVRKWLSDSTECERIWKSGNSKHQSRQFFKASERNGMRITLRDTLLDLQKSDKNIKDDPRKSDSSEHDDIEIIEIPKEVENRKKKTTPEENPKEVDKSIGDLKKVRNDKVKTRNDSPSKSDSPVSPESTYREYVKAKGIIEKMSLHKRTLDPKAKENEFNSFLETIITNKPLRRGLSGRKLLRHTIGILNEIYVDETSFTKEELERIADFADTMNSLDESTDHDSIASEIGKLLKYKRKKLNSKSSTPTTPTTPTIKTNTITASSNDTQPSIKQRPKDETLVIKHTLDNEELNKSVNELKISENGKLLNGEKRLASRRTPSLTNNELNELHYDFPAILKSSYKSFPNKRRKLKEVSRQ